MSEAIASVTPDGGLRGQVRPQVTRRDLEVHLLAVMPEITRSLANKSARAVIGQHGDLLLAAEMEARRRTAARVPTEDMDDIPAATLGRRRRGGSRLVDPVGELVVNRLTANRRCV